MSELIGQMLQRFPRRSDTDRSQALREVMQEIALAGLNRRGFFSKAAFYGGTVLRIFHKLPRFSEDLDFSLLQPEPSFSMKPFLLGLEQEFEALGFVVEINERRKKIATPIVSAFLKKTSSIYDLKISGEKALKIKFEVDTDPPLGFQTEEKLLLQPFSFYVKCFCLPDLFAGKMHAVLFRQWQQRVKGRDWFDLEWYVRKRVPINLDHLAIRARQSGHWPDHWPKEKRLDHGALLELLRERINRLDIKAARDDIQRFLADSQPLEIWSQSYFQQLAAQIEVQPAQSL